MSTGRGRDVLFGPPPEAANGRGPGAGGAGRKALFSAPPRRAGTVVVECSRCDARTPVPLLELGRLLVPSVWIPGRSFSRWMRCPSCGKWGWNGVRWRTLLG